MAAKQIVVSCCCSGSRGGGGNSTGIMLRRQSITTTTTTLRSLLIQQQQQQQQQCPPTTTTSHAASVLRWLSSSQCLTTSMTTTTIERGRRSSIATTTATTATILDNSSSSLVASVVAAASANSAHPTCCCRRRHLRRVSHITRHPTSCGTLSMGYYDSHGTGGSLTNQRRSSSSSSSTATLSFSSSCSIRYPRQEEVGFRTFLSSSSTCSSSTSPSPNVPPSTTSSTVPTYLSSSSSSTTTTIDENNNNNKHHYEQQQKQQQQQQKQQQQQQLEPTPRTIDKSITSCEKNANTTTTTTTTAKTGSNIKTQHEILSHWLHQLQSPPNLITLSRIACTPLLSYWIVTGQAEYALLGGIMAAMSDMLDGYLAKRYHMTTVLGTFLDPLADKLLINVVSISLYSISMLPAPLVLLWLFRDVGLVVVTHQHVLQQSQNNPWIMFDLTQTPIQIQPTIISKMNTVLQFFTMVTAMAHPLLVSQQQELLLLSLLPVDNILHGLCWITGATTVASAWSYMDFSALVSRRSILSKTNKTTTKDNKVGGVDGSQSNGSNATTASSNVNHPKT